MFEVGNIVVWTDEKRKTLSPAYQDFRYEIMGFDKEKISIKAISDKYLIRFTTSENCIVRDIDFERSLKLSKFTKKKKWWHIFKKR